MPGRSFLVLCSPPWFISAFIAFAFGVKSPQLLPRLRSRGLLPVFSSRSFLWFQVLDSSLENILSCCYFNTTSCKNHFNVDESYFWSPPCAFVFLAQAECLGLWAPLCGLSLLNIPPTPRDTLTALPAPHAPFQGHHVTPCPGGTACSEVRESRVIMNPRLPASFLPPSGYRQLGVIPKMRSPRPDPSSALTRSYCFLGFLCKLKAFPSPRRPGVSRCFFPRPRLPHPGSLGEFFPNCIPTTLPSHASLLCAWKALAMASECGLPASSLSSQNPSWSQISLSGALLSIPSLTCRSLVTGAPELPIQPSRAFFTLYQPDVSELQGQSLAPLDPKALTIQAHCHEDTRPAWTRAHFPLCHLLPPSPLVPALPLHQPFVQPLCVCVRAFQGPICSMWKLPG